MKISALKWKCGDFMFLQQLNLTNFRNYENVNLEFSDGINIFYGNNAQGKTNIIESIFLSSIG